MEGQGDHRFPEGWVFGTDQTFFSTWRPRMNLRSLSCKTKFLGGIGDGGSGGSKISRL